LGRRRQWWWWWWQRQRERLIFCCFKGKIKGFGGFFKEIIRGDMWF